MRLRKATEPALTLFAAALLFTACPGNQPEDAAKRPPPRTSTTASNPQAAPERAATNIPIVPRPKEFPGNRVPVATPLIQVQLLEYEIRMPEVIPSGHQTLHIANAGTRPHNFAIEGNEVSQKLADDLMRGDTTELTLDLKPGTYTVYCPVDQHRGRGMRRTITAK
jgi:hypothetical protein